LRRVQRATLALRDTFRTSGFKVRHVEGPPGRTVLGILDDHGHKV
jgi:hypothetical protein